MSVLDSAELPDDEPTAKPAARVSVLDSAELPDDEPATQELKAVDADALAALSSSWRNKGVSPAGTEISQISPQFKDTALGGIGRSAIKNVYQPATEATSGLGDLSEGRIASGAGKLAKPVGMALGAAAFPGLAAAGMAGMAGYSAGNAMMAAHDGASAGDVAENASDALGQAAAALGAAKGFSARNAGDMQFPSLASRSTAADVMGLSSKALGIARSPLKSVEGGLGMAANAIRPEPPALAAATEMNPNAIPLNTFQREPAPTRPGGLAVGDQLITPEAPPTSTFDRGPAPVVGAEPAAFNRMPTIPEPAPPEPSTFQRGPVAPRAPEPAQFNQLPPAPPPQVSTFDRGPVAPLGAEPARFNQPVAQPQPPPPSTGAPLFARQPSAARPRPDQPFQFAESGPPAQTRISMDLAASKTKPFGTPATDTGAAPGMPPLQPWVADQLPGATEGLSQANQQALMEILNRKPNMTTAPALAPGEAPPVETPASASATAPGFGHEQFGQLLDEIGRRPDQQPSAIAGVPPSSRAQYVRLIQNYLKGGMTSDQLYSKLAPLHADDGSLASIGAWRKTGPEKSTWQGGAADENAVPGYTMEQWHAQGR